MGIQPLGTSSGSMFLFHAWCIYSPRERGTMFWWKKKGLIMHVLKKTLPSDFMHIFSWFCTCTKPLGRDRQPIRAKMFISTGMPCHFGDLLQVQKRSLQPLTLYTSFHGVINVYSWRPPGDKIWCHQKPLVTSVICYKFQKNLFEVWFYTQGQNFYINRNASSLWSFVESSKKIS